jgi:DNA polymerase III subunit beta
MGFNVLYLIDVLNTLDVDILRLELSDGNSSALFTLPESPSFKYVVMPMRI